MIASERAVVINKKLFQVWEKNYWRLGRERTFDAIRAMYGADVGDILALRDRYGADYLVVEDRQRLRGWGGYAPFTRDVRRLLRTVETPAVRQLPEECVTWSSERFRVFDLACVEQRAEST